MNRSAAIRKPQAKQQAELDRVTLQAKRMGCESSGFFSLFNGQSAQCGPVNNQIQQMRGNLDQITTSLERLRSGGIGGADRENQRRSVLTALAQNNCGPQYASRRARSRQLHRQSVRQQQPDPAAAQRRSRRRRPAPSAPSASAPATAPISRCRSPPYQARFPDDERTCKALCPATEATLFTYRNPGEDINQAVSINGQPYSSLPNAFKFRTEFNPSCACKAAGQTWSDALKSVDDKAAVEQQGDIIVTEESAKKMQQRAQPQRRTAPAAKKGAAPATAAAPHAALRRDVSSCADDRPHRADRRRSRSAPVGPTFIPPKQ